MKIRRKINVDCLRVTIITIIINFCTHKILFMYLYNIVDVLIFLCIVYIFEFNLTS